MSKHHKDKRAHEEPHSEEPREEAVVAEQEAEAVAEAPADTFQPRPELQPAWPLFKDVFARWQKHWKIFTGIQVLWAAVCLGLLVLSGIALGFASATASIFNGAMTMDDTTKALVAHPPYLAALIIGSLVVAALFVIASTWMALATAMAWKWVRNEEHDRMSVRNAYASTWQRVPSYLWVSIIAFLLIALGFFGFVLPGVMLSLALAILPAIAVYESEKGVALIRRATRLSRPYLLTIFWRMIVAGVVLYVPGEIGAGILNGISNGLGDALNQLYGLVVAPIFSGVLFMTYVQLKEAESDRNGRYWISLERLTLVAAVIAAVVIALILAAGR